MKICFFDFDKWVFGLRYNRIDLSKQNDVAKSNNSKECIVCHYGIFIHGFKFQNSVCNGCHDLTMLCLNISDITIIINKDVDYRCIIYDIIKSEAVYLLENSAVDDRGYM